jgi:predicted GNAT family acetyltransferase
VKINGGDVTARGTGDEDLDEALEETFPAGDAPANTVETGIHVAATPDVSDVIDNREKARFEMMIDGQTAVLYYERTPHSLVLVHTEVPPAIRGRHVADVLAKTAIDRAHADGLQIVAVCPFVKAYLRKHPESEVRHG